MLCGSPSPALLSALETIAYCSFPSLSFLLSSDTSVLSHQEDGWDKKGKKSLLCWCVIFRLLPKPCVAGKSIITILGRGCWTLKRHCSPCATCISVIFLDSLLGSGPPQHSLSVLMLGSPHRAHWPPVFTVLHEVPKILGTHRILSSVSFNDIWLIQFFFSFLNKHILGFTIIL